MCVFSDFTMYGAPCMMFDEVKIDGEWVKGPVKIIDKPVRLKNDENVPRALGVKILRNRTVQVRVGQIAAP